MKINQPICFILNAGALGDLVASLPVIKYAVDHIWTDGKYHIVVPMHFRPLFWFVPDDKISSINEQVNFTEPHTFVNLNYVIQTPNGPSSDRLTPLKCHLTDYASINMLGTVLQGQHRDYVQLPLDNVSINKFDLPKRYACIVGVRQYKNRSINDTELAQVATQLLLKGITPVYIGKTERLEEVAGAPKDYGSTVTQVEGSISLLDKTSLLEIAKVMAGAEVVIGAETGLIHLAACTDVPIIATYSMVNPDIRVPQRHGVAGWNVQAITPPSDKCRFCQSSWFLNGHDFNNCYTETFECVSDMTATRILNAVKKILESK